MKCAQTECCFHEGQTTMCDIAKTCSGFIPESEQPAPSPVESLSAGSVVYTVLLCPMIYESSYHTVSIHRTKAGAVRAMQKLKAEMFTGPDWEYDEEYTYFKYGKLQIQE